MGLENRDYYRDSYQDGYSRSSYGTRDVVLTLVLINVAVFVLDTFSPEYDAGGTRWLSHYLGIQGPHPWYLWTYLTHGFAHASFTTSTSFWHIGGNMLALWFLGRSVEHRLGRSEFLRFYLISILVSGIGFTLFRLGMGNSQWNIVGASGAVSAVVALFIFMFPHQKLLIWGVLPVPAWLLGVIMLMGNLMSALNPSSPIAWEAHLIGAGFGVLYFMRRWDFSRLPSLNIGKLLKPRPKLKIHQPNAKEEKLKVEADTILEKISREGEESLTAKERKTLNRYSASLRKK